MMRIIILKIIVVLIMLLSCQGICLGQDGDQEKSHNQSPSHRFIDQPFQQAISSAKELAEQFQVQLSGFSKLPKELLFINQEIAADPNVVSPLLFLTTLVGIIFSGVVIEVVLRGFTSKSFHQLSAKGPNPLQKQLWHILLRTVFEISYMAAFGVTIFVIYVFYLPAAGSAGTIATNFIISAYCIRVLLFVLLVSLSPENINLRPLPFKNRDSIFFFRWILVICSMVIVMSKSAIIIRKISGDEDVFLAVVGLLILGTTTMLVCVLLQSRKRVTRFFCRADTVSNESGSVLPSCLSGSWHLLVFFFILFLAGLWEVQLLVSSKIHFGKVIVSLLYIPLFLAFDQWVQKLFNLVLLREYSKTDARSDNLKSSDHPIAIIRYQHHLIITFRLLLLVLFVMLLLSLWKTTGLTYGRIVTGSAVSIFIFSLLLYISWQFFARWVDRGIKQEMPSNEDDADEGGRGGSRRGTLLLLLRKFVLALLVVIAILFILAALGVNIVPLIAGAGIIGIAIGFGAQALIADIFSGIFFLIDDAFRVGDYIDTGSAKGMVEHISLRAVRLRHHRGMVHTVPFGKIGSVTNFSRDYIIMKLDFRVRYDTNVDQVRKIIKKIYKEILADPELGSSLIGKLKSQGVRQMDDSAMIMRAKFTTPPGEQFVMRREVYWRIQKAFRAAGIEFAHRDVTVYMPTDGDEQAEKNIATTMEDRKKYMQTGAAAGVTAIRNQELTHPVLPDDEL